MPNNVIEVGTPTRISASGISTMGAGQPLNLIGIFVAGGTAQIVQLWTQNAAGSVTGVVVLGTCTITSNAFYPIPAYCARGLTVSVTNDEVDLTIFWNPAA